MSPKKKKKPNKTKSPKKSCTSETVTGTTNKTLAKEKVQKKKTEEAAAYKCSLHMSNVLAQFIDEDSECNSPVSIEPSPSAPPESTFAVIHSPKKSAVSTSESGVPTTQHFKASPAVRPVSSLSSIISSPKKSTVSTGTCRSALHVPVSSPNYFERTDEINDLQPQSIPRPILPLIPTFNTSMPETSMLETWTLCKQSMGTNIEESKKIPGKTSFKS